jgi:hypothetical protein
LLQGSAAQTGFATSSSAPAVNIAPSIAIPQTAVAVSTAPPGAISPRASVATAESTGNPASSKPDESSWQDFDRDGYRESSSPTSSPSSHSSAKAAAGPGVTVIPGAGGSPPSISKKAKERLRLSVITRSISGASTSANASQLKGSKVKARNNGRR